MDEKVVAFALKSGFKDFAGNRHMEKLNEEMNRGKPYDWSVTLELGYLGVDSEKIINDLDKKKLTLETEINSEIQLAEKEIIDLKNNSSKKT